MSGTLCGELIKADQDALPVRSLSCELPNNIPLFLPKQNSANTLLKGNKLASFISSDEAALLMSPPLQSVPGFDIRVKPSLSLTDQFGSKFDGIIASIAEHGRSIEGSTFSISKADIRKHIFVTGITGCGKTTTVKQILKSTKDTPFLILESAKREYRRLLQEPEFPKLEVYTLGDSDVSPLRHNPFMVLPGVSLITHIDNLKSIFNASFSLYGPMPYILEKCLFNVYKNKGWNITTGKHHCHVIKDNSDAQMFCYIYPTIIDLTDEISRYVETIGYEGELKSNIKSAIITRLEALAVGSKGFLFNTTEFLNLSALLNKQVIFELESLADDDDKAFFVGLMLALVSEYRQSLARESVLSDANKTDDLRHIIVVEEAHRLLKNVSTERTSEMMGNPKGKAVESFCNIIAEMRSLGQGVIVAEQIPTKIAPDVIKNTNTKIVHRLVSFDDQIAIGAAIGLDDADSRYLNQLSTGFALVHKEGMSKPVEIKVHNNMSNNIIGDIRIRSAAKSLLKGDLEADLALHESELLWNKHVKAITIRLVNSIFLSKKELPELLPLAIREVKQVCYTEFVADKTIVLALGHCFKSNMLSPTYDIANGRTIDNSAIDALERFWDEPGVYSLDRLEAKLNQFSDVRGRILEITVNNLICKKPETGNILSLHLKSSLLIEDDSVNVEIVDAIQKRLCAI